MQPGRNLRFENYPDDSYRHDYDRSRAFMIDRVSQFSGVVALYEYGVVGAPGLSDLDFIVVLSDHLPDSDLADLIFIKDVPAYVEKTLDGSILRSMSRTQFSKIQLLGAIQTRLLWGEPVNQDLLSENEKMLVKIADVMDWLPERVLMLGDYATMEKVPVKRLVGCLHSFQHSLQRTFDIDPGFKDERRVAFQNRLGGLRKRWFDGDQEYNRMELTDLLFEGMALGNQLISEVHHYLVQNGYYPDISLESDSFFYINARKGYRFSPANEPGTVDKTATGGLYIDVPAAWFVHLAQYAKSKGPIGDLIRQNLIGRSRKTTGSMDPGLMAILDARILLCDNMAAYLERAGLYRALYRFAHIKAVNWQEWS